MKKSFEIHEIIGILKKEVNKYNSPVVTDVAERTRSPYQVLISCILSLRTKDSTTSAASNRLFEKAKTPEEMIKLTPEVIEKLIYPVGFYKNKTRNILEISNALIKKYKSNVPDSIDELLKLKGVGRKTANLVVTLGYGKPGICVDTHVHRISNRLGYVKTKTPEQTEFALRKKLPEQYWIKYNDMLVTFGQNICRPISPLCTRCTIKKYCARIGVDRSR